MDVKRLRDKLGKKFGEGSVLSAGDLDALSRISYGVSCCLSLDLAIGRTGFPSGRLTEIVGLEASGKSGHSYQVLAECQRLGGMGVLFESEQGFEAQRLRQFGVNTDELLLCQPHHLEEAFSMIEENIKLIRVGEKFKGPVVMVLDSVAGLPSEAEDEGNYDDHHMGLSARIVSQGLRKLMWLVAEHKVVLIFLNQLRKTMARFGDAYACVAGDTLIDCPRNLSEYPDGIPIRDLVGQQFYTYAWSRSRKSFVVSKVLNVWKSRRNAEVWALDYTWGKDPSKVQFGTLYATPEHRILLQNGEYCMLKDLQPKDKLIPLYRGSGGPHVGGRKRISLECDTQKYTDEHRYIYQQIFGKLDRYTHVHHIDGDCLNNDISNLQAMHGSDHAKLTAKEKMERMSDETYKQWCERIREASVLNKDKRVESLKNAWTPEMREEARLRGEEMWTDERRKIQSDKVKAQMTPERKEEISKSMREYWENVDYSTRRFRGSNLLNHEVVGVRFVGYEDVYDMEVENQHNFVANGIVVHNSYGGMAIGYRATLRIRVSNKKSDILMVGKKPVGVWDTTQIFKNKIGVPWNQARYFFNYETGIDVFQDAWDCAIAMKLLTISGGGTFKLSDGKTKLERKDWEDFVVSKFKNIYNCRAFLTKKGIERKLLRPYE